MQVIVIFVLSFQIKTCQAQVVKNQSPLSVLPVDLKRILSRVFMFLKSQLPSIDLLLMLSLLSTPLVVLLLSSLMFDGFLVCFVDISAKRTGIPVNQGESTVGVLLFFGDALPSNLDSFSLFCNSLIGSGATSQQVSFFLPLFLCNIFKLPFCKEQENDF